MKFRPDGPSSTPKTRTAPKGEKRGELFWRAFRYLCVAMAGYLFGLAAGRVSKAVGPAWPLVAILGALALVWVFRSGKKSQTHAASDAIAAAVAQAHAVAQNSTNVTVAQGHIVQGGPVPLNVRDATAPPPLEQPFAPVFEVGWDGERHEPIYDVSGVLRRHSELAAVETRRIVSRDQQTSTDDSWADR